MHRGHLSEPAGGRDEHRHDHHDGHHQPPGQLGGRAEHRREHRRQRHDRHRGRRADQRCRQLASTMRDRAASSASPTPSTKPTTSPTRAFPPVTAAVARIVGNGATTCAAIALGAGSRKAGTPLTVTTSSHSSSAATPNATGGQTRPSEWRRRGPAHGGRARSASGHALPLRSASRTSVTAAKNSADSRTSSTTSSGTSVERSGRSARRRRGRPARTRPRGRRPSIDVA